MVSKWTRYRPWTGEHHNTSPLRLIDRMLIVDPVIGFQWLKHGFNIMKDELSSMLCLIFSLLQIFADCLAYKACGHVASPLIDLETEMVLIIDALVDGLFICFQVRVTSWNRCSSWQSLLSIKEVVVHIIFLLLDLQRFGSSIKFLAAIILSAVFQQKGEHSLNNDMLESRRRNSLGSQIWRSKMEKLQHVQNCLVHKTLDHC